MVPLLLLLTLSAQAAATPSRMVAATNVRLRADPSEEVRIVTHLPLGTKVTELDTSADMRWVRVRTLDGQEGWLHEPLSKRFTPSQRLTVARSIVFDRADRFAGERAADQLAWLAVTNGLPGECEGDLFCYITWAMHLEGEYLRRHPTGAFVDQALTQLRNRFQDYWPPPDMTPWPDRCAAFLITLDSLQSAVKNVTSRWSSTTNLRDRTVEVLERNRAC